MILKGFFTRLKQYKKRCPKDSIHKKTKRGFVAVPKLYLLNDKIVFAGKDCFYYRLNENVGLKVFYSICDKAFRSREFVEKSNKISKKLHELGIMKDVSDCEVIELNTNLIKGVGYGFVLEHVKIPIEALIKHSFGYPYDWNVFNHPDHSKEGCVRYCEELKKYQKYIYSRICFESVGFDITDKKWYLFDGNLNEETKDAKTN